MISPIWNPGLRPMYFINIDAENDDDIMPKNCNDRGKVVNARFEVNCAPTRADVDNNNEVPVIIRAWHRASIHTFRFMKRFNKEKARTNALAQVQHGLILTGLRLHANYSSQPSAVLRKTMD